MNYLVTGAGGFIGSAVARRLVENSNSVTTIENFSTGYRENIPSGVELIEGDVSDIEIIESLYCRKFDAIIHIAGQSSGEISFEKPIYDLHTNTQSTVLLLNLAKRIGCKKFLYASSMSVYGDNERFECTESSSTTPKSLYAVGKLASENYMRIYAKEYHLACTALRFFNVYGVGQNLSNLKQGMASIYLAMAIKNRHIIVKGSKDRFRDFVYIDDVVDAVLSSLKNETDYHVYNICTGKPTTVEKVINSIKENLNYEISVDYVEGTPGDQFGIYGNYERIFGDLGWKPQVGFAEGIQKMVNWAAKTMQ